MRSWNQNISEDVTFHVVSRCSNNEFLLKDEADFIRYKEILLLAMEKFSFEINNYTIMNNHYHLILTIRTEKNLSEIMRWLNGIYSKDYNRRHGRCSHFWRSRYRAKPMLDDRYVLGCLRYQHRNPIRAGMVADPADWPWSGYHFLAMGKEDRLITPHPSYLVLSDNPEKRRDLYRQLVSTTLPYDMHEKEVFTSSQKGSPKEEVVTLIEEIVLPTFNLVYSIIERGKMTVNERGLG